MRSVILGLALLAAGASSSEAGRARWDYEFEVLPSPLGGSSYVEPISIANDGTVLVQIPNADHPRRYGFYRNGRLETFDLGGDPPLDQFFVYLSDLNARHEVAGNAGTLRMPYTGYIGEGFIRKPDGGLEPISSVVESSVLAGINDHGIAAGYVLECRGLEDCSCVTEWCSIFEPRTAMVVEDGEAIPLSIPGTGAGDSSAAIAIDDLGRILGWHAPTWSPWTRTWFLLDGERFEELRLPEDPSPDSLFVDLNNRGQILGRRNDPDSGMPQGFVREPDGTVTSVEWDNLWPIGMEIEVVPGERIVVGLQAQGTYVYAFNDSGEVLATAHARYYGWRANGGYWIHSVRVHGIGRRAGRP